MPGAPPGGGIGAGGVGTGAAAEIGGGPDCGCFSAAKSCVNALGREHISGRLHTCCTFLACSRRSSVTCFNTLLMFKGVDRRLAMFALGGA